METKLEIALADGTWLEGVSDSKFDITTGVGVFLNDGHRSKDGQAETLPLAKRVFIPFSSILFIVVEK